MLLWQGGFWAAAMLVGLSFVVAGASPWPRVLWWPVCAAVAYGLGPLAVGLANVQVRPRTSAQLHDLPGQLWDVTKAAAQPSLRPMMPWLAALVVAVVLTAFLEISGRDRRA